MASSGSARSELHRTTFALSPQEEALGSSLTNDIHPLYKRFNFKASALTNETTGLESNEPFLDERLFTRMMPALRLASCLLEFCLPFLAKVYCADVIKVGQQYAFDPLYECTEADIDRVRSLLVEWARRTRFYCNNPEFPLGQRGKEAELIFEAGQGALPNLLCYSLITIKRATVDFFSQEDYDSVEPRAKSSMLVHLAYILAHEQAHAVFCHRWGEYRALESEVRDLVRRVSPREPVYHTFVNPRYSGELGCAMSAWWQGGSVVSTGWDLVWIEHPKDVLGDDAVGGVWRDYKDREVLLSEAFWGAVRAAPRPGVFWNKGEAPMGGLGRLWLISSTECELVSASSGLPGTYKSD